MVVSGDKFTLRVEVDIAQAKAQLEQLGFTVTKTGQKIKGASTDIKSAGDQAAASAVKFQTLTQGAINLTTAFVQTETTISNLTKAKTSLKAAMVGVERAEDLLARKQVQLNQEMKKAIPDQEKIALLQREIATGYKDLEVKGDRVKDQQDQLNDTYKLFALNLLNVSFSAIQTGKSMFDMAKEAKLAGRAMKFLGTATGKVTIIALAAVVAWETLVGHFKIFGEEASKTFTISGQLSKIFDDMTNVSLKGMDKQMQEITEHQREYNTALSGTNKELTALQPIIKQQLDALKQMSDVSDPVKLKTALDLMGQLTGGGTRQGFSPGVSVVAPTQITPQKGVNSNVTQTSVGTSFDTEGNVVYDKHEKLAEDIEKLEKDTESIVKTNEFFPALTIDGPFGYAYGAAPPKIIQRQTELLRFQQPNFMGANASTTQFNRLLNESESKAINDYANGSLQLFDTPSISTVGPRTPFLSSKFRALSDETKLRIFQSIKNTGGYVDNKGFFRGLTALETKTILNELDNIISRGFQTTTEYDPSKHSSSGFRLDGFSKNLKEEFTKKYLQDGIANEGGGVSYSLAANIVYKRNLTPFMEGLGIPSLVTERADAFYSAAGRMRQAAMDAFDYGTNTGLSHRTIQGIIGLVNARNKLLANTPETTPERYLPRATHRIGQGLRPNDVAAFVRSGAMNVFLNNQSLNVSSGAGISQSAIEAGATYMDVDAFMGGPQFSTEILNRNRLALQRRKAQITIEDQNRNKLRTGGIRNPDLPLWDPNAVEGGFTSISTARYYWWKNFRAKGREAEKYIRQFGGEAVGHRYGKVSNAIHQMNETRSLLSRTGYSLSGFGSRPGKRGGGYLISDTAWDAHRRRVIQSNQNLLAKAGQVDILTTGYELMSYMGSALSFQDLQQRVSHEDELMRTIGLNRTEAFKIIDTEGRGRNEIDDRVRWTQRNDSISTGASVL